MSNTFTWNLEQRDGHLWVECLGELTERLEAAELVEAIGGEVVLDLCGITRINSAGIREWIRLIHKICEGAELVRLEQCSVAFTQQLNLVTDVAGTAEVASVMAPYFCDLCYVESSVPTAVEMGQMPALEADLACPECGEDMDFDDLLEVYFSFLHHH